MEQRARQLGDIRCLFLDIGGVLLTNGWDHLARKRAAANFDIDWPEMELRHNINVGTLEEGKLSLEEYLARVIFYQERHFTRGQFREFMFDQSASYPEMIELFSKLKANYNLKIFALSNEGRELNAHRIERYRLEGVIDAFVSSCFIHLRKPDLAMFEVALDIAQVPAAQIIFVDNTSMFVQIAKSLGMQGIVHTGYQATVLELGAFGLQMDESFGTDTQLALYPQS